MLWSIDLKVTVKVEHDFKLDTEMSKQYLKTNTCIYFFLKHFHTTSFIIYNLFLENGVKLDFALQYSTIQIKQGRLVLSLSRMQRLCG